MNMSNSEEIVEQLLTQGKDLRFRAYNERDKKQKLQNLIDAKVFYEKAFIFFILMI